MDTNGDEADSHPLHFHLTSGFTSPLLTGNTDVAYEKECSLMHAFSRDIYQIGPQQSLSFALMWPNYSSQDTTNSPHIRNIGAMIHCHFLQHNDANSMMIQYFVE